MKRRLRGEREDVWDVKLMEKQLTKLIMDYLRWVPNSSFKKIRGFIMGRTLQHLTFFVVFLFLFWVWVKESHGDNGSEKSIVGSGSMRVFSVPLNSIRGYKGRICQRPNPDDPGGETLRGVYCPIRLKILDKTKPIRKCVGVLIGKHRATDGDLTFDVLPNEEYKYLINDSNIKRKKGGLHCEIVPDDRIKLEDIYRQMELNSVIEVEGVWVEDTHEHNWREFHPVTNLRLLRKRD